MSDNRPGLVKVLELVKQGQVGVVAVDEQSRLSRTMNAAGLVQDLHYHGVRFLSVNENIDTSRNGWQVLAQLMGLHHNMASRDTADRVRRGQEGRVRDGNGSAGDIRFGFMAVFEDPMSAASFNGRGPKPKKIVRIDQDQALWVIEIFIWFAEKLWSINRIARELTARKVSKSKKGKPDKWRAEEVRRILGCDKYIGHWRWGATKTVRDSLGHKKQVALPPEQWTEVERPELRIVSQELWLKAQGRLQKLHESYGQKEDQAKRGPRVHHTAFYPGAYLSGILVCGKCGAKLSIQCCGKNKYFGCPKHRLGQCDVSYRVPMAKAEEVIFSFLLKLFSALPDWVACAYESFLTEIRTANEREPDEVERKKRRIAEVQAAIENLIAALEHGRTESASILKRLTQLEEEKERLSAEVKESQIKSVSIRELPSIEYLKEGLANLPEKLKGDVGPTALLLRQILGPVTVNEILLPGKKRGYGQLAFAINGWSIVSAIFDGQWPSILDASAQATTSAASPRFTLDVGGPTKCDLLVPKILEMRAQGVSFNEIGRITGLGGNAWTLYQRHMRRKQNSPST